MLSRPASCSRWPPCPVLAEEPARRRRRRRRQSRPCPACRPASTGHSTSMPPWAPSASRNSLYTDPKPDQPSGDLSDNWSEASIKPALSAEYTTGQLFADLRQAQRGRDAHLRRGADAGGRRRVLVRRRGCLHRLALRQQPRDLGENVLDFTVGRTQYKLGHGMLLGRRRGRRLAGRLLDRRAQGVRVRRDRPLQARQQHVRSVLSRQGRHAGGGLRQQALGRQLRVRDRRGHDARRHVHEVVRRSRRRAAARRARRLQPARLHGAVLRR